MAVFDAFLELKGIDGESTDSKMAGKIELDSFSWSATQMGTQHHGGGGGAGKVKISDISCTKHFDKGSIQLWLACCTGQHFETATITCRKAGGEQEVYLTIKLTDIIISHYSVGGHSKGDLPIMDEFTLNVGKIEKEYKTQTSKGSVEGPVKGGWDLKKNVKV